LHYVSDKYDRSSTTQQKYGQTILFTFEKSS
jgi:hypothetical protein